MVANHIPTPVINLNNQGIIGIMNCQRKNATIRIRIKEYDSNNWRVRLYCCGNSEKRILEPSSGGIGIRLNIAKMIFIATI